MNRGTYSQPFDFDANMSPVSSPTSTASPSDAGRGSRSGPPHGWVLGTRAGLLISLVND
jgi:hypothetical protein